MADRRQQFGQAGESIAARFLRKMGYRIIEQNYRTVLGEIDIIAKDRDTLVFVEVKARNSGRYGNPKYAVTPRKQRKISMVALHYLKSTSQSRVKARFDVVAIRSAAAAPQIELIKNAFDLAYE
ncbi:MAG: YraN family protein [Desulfobacterales bacterium]